MNTTTRATARAWLGDLIEKTHAEPAEVARMIGVTADEVARLLDASEAEALAPGTEAAVMRVLVSGGKLSTAASKRWA